MRSTSRPGILLIGNYPPPFGGVPTHIEYLADHLARRGWSVNILAHKADFRGVRRVAEGVTVYCYSRQDRLRALWHPSFRVRPVERSRRFRPRLRSFLGALGLAMLAKRIILENNVRLISAYHLLGAGSLGAWLSEDLSLPLIMTVFGEIYSDPDEHLQRIEEVRYIASRTVKWLSCSRHCARSVELIDLPIDVEPLHYGIDVDRFRPDRDGSRIRDRYGIPPDDPVVIFVGRMLDEMGLGVLLGAIPLVLARNPRIRFLIAGARHQMTPVAERRRALHPKNVFVAVDVPQDELPDYYAAANLAAAPSVNARACLGLSIVEAQGSGKPVVACDVGGTREVIVPGETGLLVAPENPFALAGAIVDLAEDHERAEKMGRQARERVRTRFDKEITNQRMESIIEAVMKKWSPV
jgi:glycosyltransferase involved in cell wall biosynthesis